MAEKHYKKSELTRERLLEVAEEQFAEKGFFGARVDEIAEAANINKRMLYAHFGSKEGLYSAVLLKTYERLAECERQFIVVGLDPIVSIRNIIFVSFKFLSENPNFVRMLLWENLNKAAAVPREALVKLKEPTIDYMRRQIRRGKVMGLFREDADEYHTVLSLMNHCFSYFSNIHTMSAILGKDMIAEREVKARAEYVADTIIKYLQA